MWNCACLNQTVECGEWITCQLLMHTWHLFGECYIVHISACSNSVSSSDDEICIWWRAYVLIIQLPYAVLFICNWSHVKRVASLFKPLFSKHHNTRWWTIFVIQFCLVIMANKIFTIPIEMLALSTRERWKNKFSNLMRWCHSFRKLNVESTCVRVQQPESTLQSENGNKNKSYSKQKVILLHSKKWNDATIFLLLECLFSYRPSCECSRQNRRSYEIYT